MATFDMLSTDLKDWPASVYEVRYHSRWSGGRWFVKWFDNLAEAQAVYQATIAERKEGTLSISHSTKANPDGTRIARIVIHETPSP